MAELPFDVAPAIGLAAGAIWYGVGARRIYAVSGAGRPTIRIQAILFSCAILTLVVALLSPLDGAAEARFSVHMVQHLLLLVVAAPLLALAAPEAALVWALPHTWRRAIGLATWLRSGRWWSALFGSLVAATLWQTVVLWFWHTPAPYGAALEHPALHAMEHLTFLATAFLFWRAIVHATRSTTGAQGVALLALVFTIMQSGVLGALLMFASRPWFTVHVAAALPPGTTLLGDQQIAALVMWIPGSVVYLVGAGVMAGRWVGRGG